MYCPNCGNEISDKAYICPKCGVKLHSSKSMVVALLLCFIFGTGGFHRFYTGYVGIGILQLLLSLTMVGLVITIPWVIIDLIMIICGKFETSDGMLLE